MGASSCIVVLLLFIAGAWVDLAESFHASNLPVNPLSVYIEADVQTTVPSITDAPPTPVADAVPAQPETPNSSPAESSAESDEAPQPLVDWRALAVDASRNHIEQRFRDTDRQNAIRRQSRSTMFPAIQEPSPAAVEAPLLAGFRFEPEFRVLGIGVTIGKCFFGIPIAGVPVEQRTPGPNVVVCAP